MGAGRKTFSYDIDTRNETNYRFKQQQKNLGTQLGGAIFMCNTRTYHTCIETMLFGLPSPHWCYVQHIRTGMPLFLYNFETKELHGIFKAASDGEWEIDPYAWTDGSRRTPYPCQVAVEVHLACSALPVSQLRAVLAENYIGNSDKFLQELTKKQAAELCALFSRRRSSQLGSGGGRSGDDWPGLGGAAGSGRPQLSASWAARNGSPVSNGSSPREMDTEPSDPQQASGLAAAAEELQAVRKVAIAAKHALEAAVSQAAADSRRPASRQASGLAAGASPAAAAASNRSLQQAAAAAAGSTAQPQAKQQSAAAPAAAGGGAGASQSGLSQLSEELTALKATCQSVGEGRMAVALQAHLSHLDEHLAQAQKEQGRAEMEGQRQAARAAQLEQEVAALKQALKLSMHGASAAALASAAPAAAPAAAPTAPAALAAAAPAFKPGAAAAKPAAGPGLRSKEELYFLGGNDQGNTAAAEAGGWLNSVLVYSPDANSWRYGPEMPLRRGYGSSGVLGGHLYVTGGGNSSEWLADCQCLDLRTGRWQAAPAMGCLRGCAGSAVLGGRLYVAGGGVADSQYDTVEIFNPEINAWMPGPKLRSRRFSTAASALDGCLYVTGGYDGSYLQSAERLDPREGKWQQLANMMEKRGAHACSAGPAGLLYVVGGYDVNNTKHSFMATVEAFEPRTGTWVPRCAMQQGRAYSAATHAQGLLWVVGGMSGEKYNQVFERYDAADDRWVAVPLPASVSTNRAFLTAAVVPVV